MRVLILGSSVINKGGEAMLRTVQAELSRRIPGASFYIGDHRARQWHPEGVVAAGVPLVPVREKGRIGKGFSLAKYALRTPEGFRYWLRDRSRPAYLDALVDAVDAAVDVSGFLFSDQRGMAAERLVPVVEAFAREGKPFVFLPQAWGPFEHPPVRELARRAVNAASVSYARDDISRAYLEGLEAGGRIEQAPDIAFLFGPSADGPRLLSEIGLDPGRLIVAIAPNMRVYERTQGEGTENVYYEALLRVGRELGARGAQVLLVPHELLPSGVDRPDDRYLCALLAEAMEGQEVAAVTEDRTAEDLKAMIGGCDLMVGSRFHALIAALSSGVPSVAVGWAHKYPELLGEFGMERLVFDHNDLTQEALLEAVMEVWDARADYRARIGDRLPDVKGRASQVFDHVSDLLA